MFGVTAKSTVDSAPQCLPLVTCATNAPALPPGVPFTTSKMPFSSAPATFDVNPTSLSAMVPTVMQTMRSSTTAAPCADVPRTTEMRVSSSKPSDVVVALSPALNAFCMSRKVAKNGSVDDAKNARASDLVVLKSHACASVADAGWRGAASGAVLLRSPAHAASSETTPSPTRAVRGRRIRTSRSKDQQRDRRASADPRVGRSQCAALQGRRQPPTAGKDLAR